jgi:sugar phosphate isomerase/epimerase
VTRVLRRTAAEVKSLTKALSEVARPGILISNTWPTSRERPGDTLAAVETVLGHGFFEAFQTVEVPYPQERRAIGSLLRREGYPLTYCLTRVLNEGGWNLSDLDEENRRGSVERAIRGLDEAREAGASQVSLISGPRPADPARRADAVSRLGKSLLSICRAAQAEPALGLIVEPLDSNVHKKCSLGLTAEAVALCEDAAREGLRLSVCVDTAHALLNGEDLLASLALARPYLAEYHYCNCVLDPAHPFYGDWHLPFGPPGVVDVAAIARLMQESMAIGFFGPETRPPIFCEVLKRAQDEPEQVMQHCHDSLERAWALVVGEEEAG